MTLDLRDIIKGFDPAKGIREELNKPVELPRPAPVQRVRAEKVDRTPRKDRPKRPVTGKPRRGLTSDILLMLADGPAPLSDLMKLASTKRTYYSRASEMRVEGLLQDTVSLTDAGLALAKELAQQQKAWDEYLAAGGVDR